MSDLRLQVSVEEARRLYQNLLRDARALFEELEGSKSETAKDEAEKEYFADVWDACETEFRLAYEMSRFGLKVDGLEGYEEDVDIFRLNCEDVDGMDPLDVTLFSELMRQQADLEDTLQYNAMCRYSMPINAEKAFNEHITKMRAIFDEYDTPQNQVQPAPPSVVSELSDLPSPQRLGEIVDAIEAAVKRQHRMLQILPKKSTD